VSNKTRGLKKRTGSVTNNVVYESVQGWRGKEIGKGKKVEAGQFNREKTVDATTASG
jgi:hypothetical protein